MTNEERQSLLEHKIKRMVQEGSKRKAIITTMLQWQYSIEDITETLNKLEVPE